MLMGVIQQRVKVLADAAPRKQVEVSLQRVGGMTFLGISAFWGKAEKVGTSAKNVGTNAGN